MKRLKFWGACLLLVVAAAVLGGCGSGQDENKVRDLSFTVVGENQLPQELKTMVEEKKADPFKLTYMNDQNLFIVVGYGSQPTGGYSITVPELYLTDNAIVIRTDLLGPEKGEKAGQDTSYPYVVVMTELLDQPVVFK